MAQKGLLIKTHYIHIKFPVRAFSRSADRCGWKVNCSKKIR